MRRNRLRELLNADQPSLGTHIHSSWPTIIELVGHSGMFDYVEFVGEYAPYDLYALENIGRAVDLFDHMNRHDEDRARATHLFDNPLYRLGNPERPFCRPSHKGRRRRMCSGRACRDTSCQGKARSWHEA